MTWHRARHVAAWRLGSAIILHWAPALQIAFSAVTYGAIFGMDLALKIRRGRGRR